MAARPQATHYPPQAATCQNITIPPMCLKCNSAAPFNNVGCSGSDNTQPCSVYCVTLCNCVCVTKQAYCDIGVQVAVDHTDTGPYPPINCEAYNEFIHRNWTAEFWNKLMDNIDTAELLGKTVSMGAGPVADKAVRDPCNNTHPADSLVTAKKYNQIRDKIVRFNSNYPQVNIYDVIRGSHAKAINDNYHAAKFNTNVCDVCNAVGQTAGVCNCNCGCACNCSCPCSCLTPCSPT